MGSSSVLKDIIQSDTSVDSSSPLKKTLVESNMVKPDLHSSLFSNIGYSDSFEVEIPIIENTNGNTTSPSFLRSTPENTSNYYQSNSPSGDFAAVSVTSIDLTVSLNNDTLRRVICNSLDQGLTLCDLSQVDLAELTSLDASSDSDISVIDGIEFLINVGELSLLDTSISDIEPISYLSQLVYLYISSSNTISYPMDIADISPLAELSRLQKCYIYGNDNLFDVSPLYRNVVMRELFFANESGSLTAHIPLCRSETDSEFWTFLKSVFPLMINNGTYKTENYYPSSCSLNTSPGYEPHNCLGTDGCPSIVLNEVYNPLSGITECASIAKTDGSADTLDLVCYTIHDDNLRSYLASSPFSLALTGSILTVPTLREATGSVVLSDVSGGVASLRGLEYATSLSSLDASDYDLSGSVSGLGYDDADAVYDRMVIQMLAKGVDYYTVLNIGLSSLSVQNTGIYRIEDVLDLTPIASSDLATSTFKLTTLDLSNNYISDVSVLITEGFFPADVMETLVLDDNYICDISGVVSTLNDYFTGTYFSSLTVSAQTCFFPADVMETLVLDDNYICDISGVVSTLNDYFTGTYFSSLTVSAQTCQCSESFSFADHKTCRRRSDDTYQVECWNGYYLDKELGTCVKATIETYQMNNDDECELVENDFELTCQVCENTADYIAILSSAGIIECGSACSEGYFGISCLSECPTFNDVSCSGNGTCASNTCTCNSDAYHGEACQYITIGDDSIRQIMCGLLCRDSDCDNITQSEMEVLTSLEVDGVDSLLGLSFAVNLTSFIITGDGTTSITIGAADSDSSISNLPTSITYLELHDVDIASDIDLTTFSNITTLIIGNCTTISSTNSNIFPSSLTYLDISGCSNIVDLGTYSSTLTNLTTLKVDDITLSNKTALSSFVGLTTLSANNTGITDDDLFIISDLSQLTTLSLSENSLTDVSLLYQLRTTLTSLDVSSNSICGLTSVSFASYLPNLTTISVSDQDTTICDECSDLAPSVANNYVCMKAWEYIDGVNGAVAVYRTDCAMFSYRDYNVTASLQCVSLVDTSPIPTCVSSLETDVNTQCIMEYGSSSVISGCIEDWYGTDCDKSCPVINSSVCGGTNGTCEESTHTCSCSSSYLGDACE
ncbi:Tubulin-specific chaperone E like protein, partial [Aduncisulcus paluster]